MAVFSVYSFCVSSLFIHCKKHMKLHWVLNKITCNPCKWQFNSCFALSFSLVDHIHTRDIMTIYMLITLKCICLTQTSLWGSTFTYPGETSACSELATFLCQAFSWTPHLDEQQPHLPSQQSWKSPWTPVCQARLPSSSQGLSLCFL